MGNAAQARDQQSAVQLSEYVKRRGLALTPTAAVWFCPQKGVLSRASLMSVLWYPGSQTVSVPWNWIKTGCPSADRG
jgi:hypothetical protein